MQDMLYYDRQHMAFIDQDYAIGIMAIDAAGKCLLRFEGVDGMNAEILSVGEDECVVGVVVPDDKEYWRWTIRCESWNGIVFGQFEAAAPLNNGEYRQIYDRYVQNIWSLGGAVELLSESGVTSFAGFSVGNSYCGIEAGTAKVSSAGIVTFTGMIGTAEFSSGQACFRNDVGLWSVIATDYVAR